MYSLSTAISLVAEVAGWLGTPQVEMAQQDLVGMGAATTRAEAKTSFLSIVYPEPRMVLVKW